jgi:hypothetical protein
VVAQPDSPHAPMSSRQPSMAERIVFTEKDASDFERKGAKTQRRKDSFWTAAGGGAPLEVLTASAAQNLCVFAPWRLGVEFRLQFARTDFLAN